MIFITQIIYIEKDRQDIFEQFEAKAIPIISKYNGRLLLRIRPDKNSMLVSDIGDPYEVHLVEFDADSDFQNFMMDEERKTFLHLKEQSVRSVLLIKGQKIE